MNEINKQTNKQTQSKRNKNVNCRKLKHKSKRNRTEQNNRYKTVNCSFQKSFIQKTRKKCKDALELCEEISVNPVDPETKNKSTKVPEAIPVLTRNLEIK